MLPYKFIALKGSICKVDIKINLENNASEQNYLTVGWLYDNYKPFENMFSWKRLNCSTRCSGVTFVNRYGIKFHYTVLETSRPKSWYQVADMCKELNASMPNFESKDRISEFVALLKIVKKVPDMDAIPIGLRYNYSKVGIILMSPFTL